MSGSNDEWRAHYDESVRLVGSWKEAIKEIAASLKGREASQEEINAALELPRQSLLASQVEAQLATVLINKRLTDVGLGAIEASIEQDPSEPVATERIDHGARKLYEKNNDLSVSWDDLDDEWLKQRYRDDVLTVLNAVVDR